MNTTKNKKIQIAVYLPSFYPLAVGGAEMQAKRLAEYYLQNDIDVFFITPHQKSLARSEMIDNIPVHRFRTIRSALTTAKKPKAIHHAQPIFDYSDKQGNDLTYAKSQISIRHIIYIIDLFLSLSIFLFKKRNKFDILQINTVTYLAVIITLVGKILRKKVIIKDSTMDGITQMHMTPFPETFRSFIVRNADFVAMTEFIHSNMIKCGIPPERIHNISNGIPLQYPPVRNESCKYKCLFVGNLYQQPAKGIDILLKSWSLVVKELPQATLTIVGDGNITAYRNYIDGQNLANSVTFTGRCDPSPYYSSHDLFILPSRREGMSNALMEAMLYGMPVIATNISGNQDLIRTRFSGLLIEPNNIKMLYQSIVECLNNYDKCREWGKNARKNIETNYSISNIAQQYIKLYKSFNN